MIVSLLLGCSVCLINVLYVVRFKVLSGLGLIWIRLGLEEEGNLSSLKIREVQINFFG